MKDMTCVLKEERIPKSSDPKDGFWVRSKMTPEEEKAWKGRAFDRTLEYILPGWKVVETA